LVYVFWAPFQQRAGWFEWTATALTLATVLALFLAALAYDEHRRIVAGISTALLLVAIGFLAYRPSGGIYFPVAAAFVAPAVGGRVGLTMTILSAVAALFGLEWFLLYSPTQGAFFPLLVGVWIFVSGFGAIFAVRQTRELQRRDKASERERIAKDLHDVVGHSLSSLALKAELARRVFHSDPQRALLEISDVERIARQGLEEMRGAIHGYHSGDIYAELGRVESLLKAADVNVECRCEQLEMPAAQERVLALILREAVTNILRHSQARKCRLGLFCAEGAYRLEISDDGRGGTHEEGVGMRSIRTRAEAFGGTAVWSSATGTQLSVSLPVSAMEHG
jgi:two-component system sensor histidine kinase DesK